MISKVVVEEAVDAILKGDKSYCECRRSPFDGHDVNPPCGTRIKVTEQVTLTLEIAAQHTSEEKPEPVRKKQWAIFGKNSPADAKPIIRARFSSREAALTYVKENFPSSERVEVRGRSVSGWAR